MALGKAYLRVQAFPQGLKPPTESAGRAARLKSCPFKAPTDNWRAARDPEGTQPCPFKAVHFSGVA